MRATGPGAPGPQAPAPLMRMLRRVAEGRGAPDLEAYASACHLSAPERRVLAGLVAGRAGDAVAAHLGLTPNTVRRHVAAVRRKTGHASVAQLLMAIGRLPPALWTDDEGK